MGSLSIALEPKTVMSIMKRFLALDFCLLGWPGLTRQDKRLKCDYEYAAVDWAVATDLLVVKIVVIR